MAEGQAEYEKIVENSNDEKMINNKNLGGKQARGIPCLASDMMLNARQRRQSFR